MSARTLITIDEFRAAARENRAPTSATVLRFQAAEPKVVDGQARTLRFCFSDGSVDRAGDTIDPQGWDLTGFRKNPVALWSHDSWQPPIGRALNIVVEEGARLMGDIAFIEPEIHPFADTIFKMVKAGYINAVSVGFVPKDYEWSDEDGREWGIDFKQQELLEISVVPVPCNANALVEARAAGIDTRPLQEWAERMLDGGGRILVPRKLLEATFKAAKTPRSVRQKYLGARKDADWKCGASRDLAIDESESWDGAAAEASIFAHASTGSAGDDDFDPAVAKKGFLAYDASAPKLKGSYKLPFAHVVGGTLKAVKGGIHAAASRLPDTDISESARSEARAVIDHYEAKMSDGKNGRGRRRDGDGMNETDPAAGGDAIETDIMGDCGKAIDEECGMKDPAQCATHAPLQDGDAKRVGTLLLRVARGVKAGRVLSAANEKDLRDAAEHHAKAATLHETATAAHAKAAEHHNMAQDCIKAVLERHDEATADDTADDNADDGNADDKAARERRVAQLRQRVGSDA